MKRDRSWLRPAFTPTSSLDEAAVHLLPERRAAVVDGRTVDFSRVEYDVVELLATHPGVLIMREELSLHAWGEPLTSPDKVTSTIKRIRKRLQAAGADPDHVVTIHTLGYRWDADPQHVAAPRLDQAG